MSTVFPYQEIPDLVHRFDGDGEDVSSRSGSSVSYLSLSVARTAVLRIGGMEVPIQLAKKIGII